ncbi:MAG: hypothetical protein HZA79_04440 [Sphingobacteriales bacterium]|nr:hypothetical protein [Sphingobacteriales bacterium]
MNTEKENRIEEILNSLDGCTRAEAPAFFYTRLKARMEKETITASSWMLRPAYTLAGLLLILAINILVLYNRNTTFNESTAGVETESIQSLAAEYRLNDNSSQYDLNQVK